MKMPQLVPFYFLNQMMYGYTVLLMLMYVSSKFMLPRMLNMFLSRMFMTKLGM
uniref:ATP synthase protein 8 n=1 Tax=Geotrichum candidum TaxID=1173061 RepID=A0A0A1I5R3_GEOCN|nr:ATPase subunit 8 [Geotrichum candidum]CDI44092.1 ATPase subunit 8 [Geotrichum candidum]